MNSRNVNSFIKMENFFGEETTMKGWPSPAGNGLQFFAWHYFSISAQAENPDGAWAFLKYIMYHAECRYRHNMPVNLALLDEMAKYDYEREDAFRLSKSVTDRHIAIFKATRSIDRGNRDVLRILNEEIDSYLSGQKSADDVAAIIENRIGIYLAEQE